MPDGRDGELVLTTLNKEAFPLVRYRTGDITSITREKCQCGRTFLRIKKIEKRIDDLIIINGVKIYPLAINNIISKIDNLGDKFEIITTREQGEDKLELRVEIKDGTMIDVLKNLQRISDNLKKEIFSIFNIDVSVKLVESSTLSHIKKRYRIVKKR